MKKIIILIFILCSFSKLKSQILQSYADTANYLIHEIEVKKSLYIGKPFSVLLDSLKIQPVNLVVGASSKSDFGKYPIFNFNYERDFDKEHFIVVGFNIVPAYDVLYPILFPGIGIDRNFTQVINLYKPLIVKNIDVKDYTDDEPVNPNVHY